MFYFVSTCYRYGVPTGHKKHTHNDTCKPIGIKFVPLGTKFRENVHFRISVSSRRDVMTHASADNRKSIGIKFVPLGTKFRENVHFRISVSSRRDVMTHASADNRKPIGIKFVPLGTKHRLPFNFAPLSNYKTHTPPLKQPFILLFIRNVSFYSIFSLININTSNLCNKIVD